MYGKSHLIVKKMELIRVQMFLLHLILSSALPSQFLLVKLKPAADNDLSFTESGENPGQGEIKPVIGENKRNARPIEEKGSKFEPKPLLPQYPLPTMATPVDISDGLF